MRTAPGAVRFPGSASTAGREAGLGLLFILPSLAGFIVFFVVPAVRGLLISFTDWNLLTAPRAVGLANYAALLNDPDFWNALKVTALYVLWNIPVQTVLAVIVALVMNAAARSSLLKGMVLLPWLMPNVVVALLWVWLLDPTIGLINVAVKALGGPLLPFLSSPGMALPTIAGINIWRYLGYTALLVFAGLQTIPPEVYEAARIDGAGDRQTFWRITLPLLRPVLAFVVVTSVLGSFQIFDTVAVTTKGGPIATTKVFNYMIYQQAFERFQMGYATAVSMVLFLILVGVGLLQMKLLRAGEAET
ncbi:MAG TPA: sugar ABC transporter permease [Spirochaetia bacterium]|nr:sugar ABC transporter permease [Spirochaetia bacterium]